MENQGFLFQWVIEILNVFTLKPREKQPGETTLFYKKTNYTWRSRLSKQIEWSASFISAS